MVSSVAVCSPCRDHVRKSDVSPGLHCRLVTIFTSICNVQAIVSLHFTLSEIVGVICQALQVLPSSGNRSVSLWDVPETETLQTWLDEFLDVDCSNEVFEVRLG